MPDHIHLLLTPAPEISLEKAIQYIKGGFSFRLKSKLDVWERSYTNHRITNKADYIRHTNYIHQNPVDANLASAPRLFEYSSANPKHPLDPIPSHFEDWT
jgi:putative transposase